jgi:surfeit locus 1 family protein
MRIGRRRFAPSWLATALTASLCAAFIGLGVWQWQRGNMRHAQTQAFAQGAGRVQSLGSRSLEHVPRFQRVSVLGRYDTDHQFLLDNRIQEGRAGYDVLTPLALEDGRIILVNRGWLPFSGFRDRLPNVAFNAPGMNEVVGRVDELPVAGLEGGRAAPASGVSWPRVTSFPGRDELSRALGRKIESRILLLDEAAPYGYSRRWHPPGLAAIKHWSYAIQWWSFAALAAILWCVLSLRKAE